MAIAYVTVAGRAGHPASVICADRSDDATRSAVSVIQPG